MKVCYWGTYDAAYPRNRTLIDGLRAAGAEVVELNEPLWKSSGDKLARAAAWWRSPGFLLRWLGAYLRLARRLLLEKNVDCLVVGYTGHFDMFAAKPLTLLKGVPVVFDAFLSLYEAFVEDRAVVRPGSLKALLLRAADKYSCALADAALLDTEEHIRYFVERFGLPRAKFRRSFVGANEEGYGARPAPAGPGPFTVLHFGTFIPLHGMEHILRAAKELEGEPGLRFRLVGGGAEYPAARELAARLGLRNAEFVPYRDMPALLAEVRDASACLGIFGGTGKAGRVIPNKVYLALAMARPVITGDSPVVRELLADGRDCLLCPMADPRALAAAILRLKADPAAAAALAKAGHGTFLARASVPVLGAELAALLKELKQGASA